MPSCKDADATGCAKGKEPGGAEMFVPPSGGCMDVYVDGGYAGNTCDGRDDSTPQADRIGAAHNAAPSDRQIQKGNSCILQAFGTAGMAGAADFVGLPANVGQNLGPSFPGMSPNGAGGVEVTAGDVALLLKESDCRESTRRSSD